MATITTTSVDLAIVPETEWQLVIYKQADGADSNYASGTSAVLKMEYPANVSGGHSQAGYSNTRGVWKELSATVSTNTLTFNLPAGDNSLTDKTEYRYRVVVTPGGDTTAKYQELHGYLISDYYHRNDVAAPGDGVTVNHTSYGITVNVNGGAAEQAAAAEAAQTAAEAAQTAAAASAAAAATSESALDGFYEADTRYKATAGTNPSDTGNEILTLATGKHLVLGPGTWNFTASATLSDDILSLTVEPGALITLNAGVTLTLDVPVLGIDQGHYCMSPSNGTYNFLMGALTELNPGVFQSDRTSGADWTTAIQTALDAAKLTNNGEAYHSVLGGVDIYDGPIVRLPAGIFTVTGLTMRNCILRGSGQQHTLIKHNAGGDTTADLIVIGDEITNGNVSGAGSYADADAIYATWIEDLALEGEGDMVDDDGVGTGDDTLRITSRYGVWWNKAFLNCGMRRVSVSMCQVGVYDQSSWTVQVENCNIWTCLTCIDWNGGHAEISNTRLQGFYNAAVQSAAAGQGVSRGMLFRKDPYSGITPLAVTLRTVHIQQHALQAFVDEGGGQISFEGCLFEKCDRSGGNLNYLDFTNADESFPRIINLTNCYWTGANNSGTSSVGLSVNRAKSVVLTSCRFSAGSGSSLTASIVTTTNCDRLIILGGWDAVGNRTIDAGTTTDLSEGA